MAITKRLRVSFDLKVVERNLSSENLANLFVKEIKRIVASEDPLDGIQKALITASLTGGPEAAYEFALKKAVIDTVKEELTENGRNSSQTVSNFSVRVIK